MSDDAFVSHRSLLFTVAYEMLGSASDAEDVVQETWLRWADVDDAVRDEVRDPRAYLVRIVTRQALNRLRSLARRREEYVGEWLPEPLLTSPDVADDVEFAESVSIAMLTVLETLATGRTRRLRAARGVRRALRRDRRGGRQVHLRRPPGRASGSRTRRRAAPADAGEPDRAAGGRGAVPRRPPTGDLQGLLDVLAPDVVFVADGGGLAPAARHPVEGSEHVAAFLCRFPQLAPGAEISTPLLNGAVAVWIDPAGEANTAVTFTFEGGRIARIYAIRNPHKLRRLEQVAELTR